MYLEWFEENYDLWKDYDYVGTLSWRFNQKIPIPDVNKVLRECIIKNIDIYSFYKIRELYSINRNINHWVPKNLRHIWISILKKMGYRQDQYLSNQAKQFYCNYWICKRELMMDYCKFCQKVRGTLESSRELDEYINSDYGYNGKLPKERCMEIFGKPYYTMHPFLFESMPCFYFWVKGYRVK
jgi:hypothetical protein